MPLGKADKVTVCLTEKLNGVEMFKPNFEESIDIIRQFDKN